MLNARRRLSRLHSPTYAPTSHRKTPPTKSTGGDGCTHSGFHRLEKKKKAGVMKVATYAATRGSHPSACFSNGLRVTNETAIKASCANVGIKKSAAIGARRNTPTPRAMLTTVHAEKQTNPTQSLLRSLRVEIVTSLPIRARNDLLQEAFHTRAVTKHKD